MIRRQRSGPTFAAGPPRDIPNATTTPDQGAGVTVSVAPCGVVVPPLRRQGGRIACRTPDVHWRWAGRDWTPQRFGLDDGELQRELLRMLDAGWSLAEARAVLIMPRWWRQ